MRDMGMVMEVLERRYKRASSKDRNTCKDAVKRRPERQTYEGRSGWRLGRTICDTHFSFCAQEHDTLELVL